MAENTENIEKTAEELAAEKAATTAKPAGKAATGKDSKPATEKVTSEKESTAAERAEAKEVAKRCNVKVIYKNTKGEYFTSPNLAVASENGFKDKVKTFEF